MFAFFSKGDEKPRGAGILDKVKWRLTSDLIGHRDQIDRLKDNIADLSEQLAEHESASAAISDALNTIAIQENVTLALADDLSASKVEATSLLRPATMASIVAEPKSMKPPGFA